MSSRREKELFDECLGKKIRHKEKKERKEKKEFYSKNRKSLKSSMLETVSDKSNQDLELVMTQIKSIDETLLDMEEAVYQIKNEITGKFFIHFFQDSGLKSLLFSRFKGYLDILLQRVKPVRVKNLLDFIEEK